MAQTLNQVAFSSSSSLGLTASACRSQARRKSAPAYSSHDVHSCRCAHAAGVRAKKSEAQISFLGLPFSRERVNVHKRAKLQIVRAAAEGATELEKGSDGPPVPLGTAELPEDINLPKLKQLLYQVCTVRSQHCHWISGTSCSKGQICREF